MAPSWANSSNAMDGSSRLDPEAMQRLRLMLGSKAEQMLPDLIRRFAEEGNRLLEAARQALQAGQLEALRRAAHSLKSSSRLMGADHLADLCKSLEKAAETGELDQARVWLSAIPAELEHVNGMLKEGFHGEN